MSCLEMKIFIVDKLSYTQKSHTNTSYFNVPLIDQTHPVKERLGFGMYMSLIGTFDFPTPISYLGMTSVGNTICISEKFL